MKAIGRPRCCSVAQRGQDVGRGGHTFADPIEIVPAMEWQSAAAAPQQPADTLAYPVALSCSPAMASTRSTIRRLTLGSPMCMNALVKARPSDEARKSDT